MITPETERLIRALFEDRFNQEAIRHMHGPFGDAWREIRDGLAAPVGPFTRNWEETKRAAAREVVADFEPDADRKVMVREGQCDDLYGVRVALAALVRGWEMHQAMHGVKREWVAWRPGDAIPDFYGVKQFAVLLTPGAQDYACTSDLSKWLKIYGPTNGGVEYLLID